VTGPASCRSSSSSITSVVAAAAACLLGIVLVVSPLLPARARARHGDDNRGVPAAVWSRWTTPLPGVASGHPRRRQHCYWDELAPLLWTDVRDWPARSAPLPLPPALPYE
jgi:hypothetical protein